MSTMSEPNTHNTLYHEVADRVMGLIEAGTYAPGSRIPSIRSLSNQLAVSVNTVKEAYWLLETRKVIEGRPQAGYFVRRLVPGRPLGDGVAAQEIVPRTIHPNHICSSTLPRDTPYHAPELAKGSPDHQLFPLRRLSANLAAVTRQAALASISYADTRGVDELREQIARQAVEAGIFLSPDDFLVTNGCMEAIVLAIQVVCRPGDTIAVESPGYYDFLSLLENQGLKVVEIPVSPEGGMNLDILEWVLDNHTVSAVLTIPTYNNPMGSCMPPERRETLVGMLSRRGITLIEDDVYGELSFAGNRPKACKAWDKDGTVIYCSSVSKTLAPGYRIGWVSGGRWHERIHWQKRLVSVATSTPPQLAVAWYLKEDNYARHLRNLRARLAENTGAMAALIADSFPSGTRLSRPAGGFFLWLELPETIDTMKLYENAQTEGIFFRPGRIFSAGNKFGNCLRLCSGSWNPAIEAAVARLGELARVMA